MTRSMWSDRPLGVKLAALVAAGALALAVFAVVTVQALQGTGERAATLLTTTHVTGEALEADMMHDAVRGDVLAALLSATPAEYQTAVDDLAAHSQKFRDILAEIESDNLSPEVNAAVEAVLPDVEGYLTSADQIITLAGQNRPAAQAAYPQFGEVFAGLEESLPTVGEAIGA